MLDADAVYGQYRSIVYGYLYTLCHDHDFAEELAQETFYQAIKHKDSFKGKSSIGTWLCAIAKNQYYSALRKPVPVSLEEAEEQSVPDFSDAVADKSLAMNAYKALHELPEPYREVFTLRIFCELSHRDIAELFEKSESWARVTYYRAKNMLAEKMKGETSDE